jgi:hypothetical protein
LFSGIGNEWLEKVGRTSKRKPGNKGWNTAKRKANKTKEAEKLTRRDGVEPK